MTTQWTSVCSRTTRDKRLVQMLRCADAQGLLPQTAEAFVHLDLSDVTLGAKDCKPEIDTSEIIVDFQWHFPMDCHSHFPTDFYLSVVFSKGLPLFQLIFNGSVKWTFSGIFHWNLTFVTSGVESFALRIGQPRGCRSAR